MDFFAAVKDRHSYRGPFQEKALPDADIRQILQAGLDAPSGLNLQTTSFWVVKNLQLRQEIAALLPSPATKTAPIILVVASEKVVKNGMCFEVEDYAAAVENVLLAAVALGYGAVWMDGMTRADEVNTKIAALLQIPTNKTVRTVIPLGVPMDSVTAQKKKPYEERVTVVE